MAGEQRGSRGSRRAGSSGNDAVYGLGSHTGGQRVKRRRGSRGTQLEDGEEARSLGIKVEDWVDRRMGVRSEKGQRPWRSQ